MTSTSDSARVEQALRAAFHDVTRDVHPKADTGRTIARRLRRRRRRTAAASIVAAAAAIATALIVARTSDNAGPAVLTPVEPKPSAVTLDVVGGVRVTWLPRGVHRTFAETRKIGDRTFVYSTYHLGAPDTLDNLPTFYVVVTRDAPPTPLGPDRRLNYFASFLSNPPARLSGTTIHGRPAQLVKHGESGPDVSYDLSWREDGASVVVTGETRATLDQVIRVAQATVVGPATTPAGNRFPESAVRDGITRALASTTVEAAIAGLEDGPALRATVEKVINRSPKLAGTVEIEGFGPVTMVSNHEAEAELMVKADNGSQEQEWSQRVRAVLTPTGWTMSRDSYCGLISFLNVHCPSG